MALLLPASIDELAADTGRATCIDVTCNGAVPNAFDIRTRNRSPPTDKCTICRKVASRIASVSNWFCFSGTCCDDAHDPTQCAVDAFFCASTPPTISSQIPNPQTAVIFPKRTRIPSPDLYLFGRSAKTKDEFLP